MKNFEIPQKNNALKHEFIDEEWSDKLTNIKQLSAYNYFTGLREYSLNEDTLQDGKVMRAGVREKTKQAFFQGDIDTPELYYLKLESLDAQTKEAALIKLKEAIQTQEPNETLKKLYLWKINEKIAENRMLQAAQNGDDRKFTKYSTFIYGKPEKETFDYTLASLLVKARKCLNDPTNILAQRAADRLLKEFSSHSDLEDSISLSETKNSDKEHLLDLKHTDPRFQLPSDTLEKVNTQDNLSYTDEEIAQVFTESLIKYDLTDWEVIIDDTRTTLSIGKKKVFIPKDITLSQTHLNSLIAHEIGVHARRQEYGLRTKLKILSIGLDRTKDDEGIAMYEQQKIIGTDDFAGFDGYLATSLALGLDGKKRDFKAVFDILTDHYLVAGKNYADAQEAAWKRCVRTFRGTSGKTPGACFTKDIVYRDNNIGVWNLVKNNSPEVRRFMIGRYDPTNQRHIWILDQFNITDEDLQQLEQKSS